MPTQLGSVASTQGHCAFCKVALPKNKMTQHLKNCKARRAEIGGQEEQPEQEKTTLFHILAEGKYNPQYWLHFEVDAEGPLWLIDDFLKDMWITDLDHLSGFTINGTSYGEDVPGEAFFLDEMNVVEEEEEEEKELSEEEREEVVREFIDQVIAAYTSEKGILREHLPPREMLAMMVMPFSGPISIPDAWIAEIKTPRSYEDLLGFLRAEQVRLEKEGRQLTKKMDSSLEEQRNHYQTLFIQKSVIRTLLEGIEDRSLDVLLKYVLSVGQKFSYIYDFGSSTYVDLRVLAQREGVVPDLQKPVRLMAQNDASEFKCVVCGKPATRVAMDYYTASIEKSVYCARHAKRKTDEGETLPIINSPRVGVL